MPGQSAQLHEAKPQGGNNGVQERGAAPSPPRMPTPSAEAQPRYLDGDAPDAVLATWAV